MTDGTAGWFRDPTDPTLARWHDGTTWTAHTLVIADQTPGSEPPPPPAAAPAPPTGAVPTGAPTWDDDAAYSGGYTVPATEAGLSGKVRGMPTWAKVLGPVLVVAILGIAFLATSGGDDGDGKTETAATETIDAAVAAARRAGLPAAVADAKARGLIVRFCAAATDASEVPDLGDDLGNLPVSTSGEVRQSVSALGAGARTSCADDMRKATDLIPDLQDAAQAAFATTTTAPTIPPDDTSSTVAGDPGATTTVKGGGGGKGTGGTGGGTVTTKAPATTTTKALPVERENFPCSAPGAQAKTKGGAPLECRKSCFGSSTKWQSPGTCPTTPTTPTTQPGQTVPTAPTTASTA